MTSPTLSWARVSVCFRTPLTLVEAGRRANILLDIFFLGGNVGIGGDYNILIGGGIPGERNEIIRTLWTGDRQVLSEFEVDGSRQSTPFLPAILWASPPGPSKSIRCLKIAGNSSKVTVTLWAMKWQANWSLYMRSVNIFWFCITCIAVVRLPSSP